MWSEEMPPVIISHELLFPIPALVSGSRKILDRQVDEGSLITETTNKGWSAIIFNCVSTLKGFLLHTTFLLYFSSQRIDMGVFSAIAYGLLYFKGCIISILIHIVQGFCWNCVSILQECKCSRENISTRFFKTLAHLLDCLHLHIWLFCHRRTFLGVCSHIGKLSNNKRTDYIVVFK